MNIYKYCDIIIVIPCITRGEEMSIITVRLNEDEENAFKDYANIHDTKLSTLLKDALTEKMEDEMD